jgi:hypothetical protein
MTTYLHRTQAETYTHNGKHWINIRPLDALTITGWSAPFIVGHIAHNAYGETVLWDEDHARSINPNNHPITRVESTI